MVSKCIESKQIISNRAIWCKCISSFVFITVVVRSIVTGRLRAWPPCNLRGSRCGGSTAIERQLYDNIQKIGRRTGHLPPAMVMVPSPSEGESEQEFMHFGVGYTHQPYLVTVYFGRKPVTNRSFPCKTRVIWVPGGIYLN